MTIKRPFPAILSPVACNLYSVPPNFEISRIPDGKFAPLRKEIPPFIDVFGFVTDPKYKHPKRLPDGKHRLRGTNR